MPVNLASRPPIAGHAISNRVTSPSSNYYTPSSYYTPPRDAPTAFTSPASPAFAPPWHTV